MFGAAGGDAATARPLSGRTLDRGLRRPAPKQAGPDEAPDDTAAPAREAGAGGLVNRVDDPATGPGATIDLTEAAVANEPPGRGTPPPIDAASASEDGHSSGDRHGEGAGRGPTAPTTRSTTPPGARDELSPDDAGPAVPPSGRRVRTKTAAAGHQTMTSASANRRSRKATGGTTGGKGTADRSLFVSEGPSEEDPAPVVDGE